MVEHMQGCLQKMLRTRCIFSSEGTEVSSFQLQGAFCVGVLFKTEKWNQFFGRRVRWRTIVHHLKPARKMMCICSLDGFIGDECYFQQS